MSSFPTIPFATFWARGRGYFRASGGWPMGIKQFMGKTARAVVLNVWGLQKTLEALDLDIVPQSTSSSASLDAWAFLLGLPNGAGGYGRLVATPASGGQAHFTGALGTSYANGAIATAEDGSTQVKVSGAVSIPGTPPGSGNVLGNLVAVTLGSVGNLTLTTIFTWQSPPAGSDPTFTLDVAALIGGLDVETDPALYVRILQRLQTPPRGGTAQDYRTWAELVASIFAVYIYGRRSGTGTVDIVVLQSGSSTGVGTSRAPSAALVTSVQTMVDSLRPVAADAANVLAPFVSASGHVIRVRVVPSGAANAFDWGSDVTWTGTPFTVASYAGGPPPTLTLNTTAPLSLQTAIANYIADSANAPRLQVLSTSGPPINPPINVVAIDGTKTILTLATPPTGWKTPTNGDVVYPYGPVVGTIAANELALIDGLGPSRVSGYGDPYSVWQDTLAINQIARVAEDAVDAFGNALITEVIDGGATIDGSSASDLEANDATPGQAPELLWTSHIAVTP